MVNKLARLQFPEPMFNKNAIKEFVDNIKYECEALCCLCH